MEGGYPVAKIVLEVPDSLKALVRPMQRFLDAVAQQVVRCASGAAAQYERFEGKLAERAAELEREAHRVALCALDVNAPRIWLNGEEYVRVLESSPGSYKTQTGEVVQERALYRQVGCRTGQTVDLISLRAAVVGDGWLPGTARAMAHLLQQGTSREAEVTAQRLGRLPYSRSSFETVGHEVGCRYRERQAEIEDALIMQLALPEAAASVSVSLDRVSLPMEEPRPKPPGRPRKDAAKRPIRRVFRMAYCGTLTLHDAKGQALHTIRYGCMPQGDARELVAGMARDVLALREQTVCLPVSLLCDGAKEMWNLLESEFDDRFGFATHLIDYWHLLEKLSAAADAIDPEQSAATLKRWKLRLLNCNAAAEELLHELQASGKQRVRIGKDRPVHAAITYLENNAHRMHYASSRRRGLPIGSGNVEATCKSLIAQRMKRSGARWKHETGEDVIQLRALALSDRWDPAMNLTLRAPAVRVRVKAAA
jgi:hypothetical protein